MRFPLACDHEYVLNKINPDFQFEFHQMKHRAPARPNERSNPCDLSDLL